MTDNINEEHEGLEKDENNPPPDSDGGSIHVVIPGEWLSKIANSYGIKDWEQIYNHPKNADFKKKRPNPNIIFPGDLIFIPKISNLSQKLNTGKKHVYQAQSKDKPEYVNIVLQDNEGKPDEGVYWEIKFDDEQPIKGKTSSDGLIKCEIPYKLQYATLTYRNNVHPLFIGGLDPIQTTTGIQARLANLGYYTGNVDGIIGPLTKSAIRKFQKDNNLDVDGIYGPITRSKLKEVYNF